MNARPWIAALAAACLAPAAGAETLYVIEQLIVTVNTLPDGTGERVAQIKSGDPVELLERQDEQAHIRLPSGEEGWVKASYLSGNPPLAEQLRDRVQELEKARADNARLETELAAAKRAVTVAAASAAAKNAADSKAAETKAATAAATRAPEPEAPAAPAASTDSAVQSSPPLFADEPIMPSRPSWWLALLAMVVALAGGFALGWHMLDRRIRAKYGGLRIY